MKSLLKALALSVVAVLAGCASYPVAATVVSQPGTRVTAQQSKFSFLWLSPLPLDTASDLLDNLVEQCAGADVTGVTTGVQIGFAVVGQVERIIVSGYCAEPVAESGGRLRG
jgi:hypothetical protein